MRFTLANLTLEWVVQDILLCRAYKMALGIPPRMDIPCEACTQPLSL